MSFFIYSGTKEPFTGKPVPLDQLNKNTMAKKHLENLYYLRFITNNPASTFAERYQAGKEILICEKKIQYWSRFKDFDQATFIRDNTELRNIWNSKTTQPKKEAE